MKRKSILVGLGIALAWAGLSVIAGPINPPAGPVVPTGKTLTEVEPRIAINAANTPGNVSDEYIITQPGSYYLTGNITTSKVVGINVACNSVTIDLGGFVVATTAPDSINIFASGAAFNVHDGRLTGSSGVNSIAVYCGADQAILRRLSITCEGQPIYAGSNAIIEDVAISSNTTGAVSLGCGAGAQVRRVQINGAGGINVAESSLIQDTIVKGSRGVGIQAYSGSTIIGCTVFQNAAKGIAAATGCTITGCTAYQNTGGGIVGGDACTITGCTATFNTVNGILVGVGGTVAGCTSSTNTGVGISASQFSTISNCTVGGNSGEGIFVTTQCLVIGNTCANNFTGIHTSSVGNRVEGNNCVGNSIGIQVTSNGNVIVKNTCSGNPTNWSVAAGNTVAPIAGGVNAAAINGNSYSGSIGSTDPNANFTY